MKVYILATCRRPELLPATLMVFKSLRVGFPTADVHVSLNLDETPSNLTHDIIEAAHKAGCSWSCFDKPPFSGIAHPVWIEHVIKRADGCYAIIDTDMVFHANCEGWQFGQVHYAGVHTPRFFDHVTNAITLPRIHTSFMWVPDGEHLRKQIDTVREQDGPYIGLELFKPLCYVQDGRRFFQDTATGLYQVCATAHFGPEQLQCYDHLNNGTLIDIVEQRHPQGKELRARCEQAFADPQSIRGSWAMYEQYYQERKVS